MSLLIKYSYVLIWLRKCKLPTYFNQREMKIISKTLPKIRYNQQFIL